MVPVPVSDVYVDISCPMDYIFDADRQFFRFQLFEVKGKVSYIDSCGSVYVITFLRFHMNYTRE